MIGYPSRKMELSCSLKSTRRDRREKIPRKPYNRSFIDQAYSVKWRLKVSALVPGASGPGSSLGRGHCVVFLGKTPNSHSASLHSQWPAMDLHPVQGGAEILLAASCYKNQDELRLPWASGLQGFTLLKMAGYWPRSFFLRVYGRDGTNLDSVSVHQTRKNWTWPVSSHFDLMLGQ